MTKSELIEYLKDVPNDAIILIDDNSDKYKRITYVNKSLLDEFNEIVLFTSWQVIKNLYNEHID